MPVIPWDIIFPYSSLAVVKIWETIYCTPSNIQVFSSPVFLLSPPLPKYQKEKQSLLLPHSTETQSAVCKLNSRPKSGTCFLMIGTPVLFSLCCWVLAWLTKAWCMHPTSCDENCAQDKDTQAVQLHGGLHLYPLYKDCTKKNLSLCKYPELLLGSSTAQLYKGLQGRWRADLMLRVVTNKTLINVRDMGAGNTCW